MWLEHKSPSWRDNSGNEDIERWKARIFSLRTRMLAFVRQVLAFATGEVLEPNWKALEEKLAKVQTVDQLLRDHVDFLDTCLKQCMLTTSKLLNVRVDHYRILLKAYKHERFMRNLWRPFRSLCLINHLWTRLWISFWWILLQSPTRPNLNWGGRHCRNLRLTSITMPK